MKRKERSLGPDLIRTLAICLVFVVHMLATSKALSRDLRTVKWVIYDFARYLSIMAVPLFLLLTGFLQSKRKLSARHYTGVIPTFFSYLITSGLVAALSAFFIAMPKGGVSRLALNIFDYTYGYAWYMEMYLCLFLLIPFLNIFFNALSQKQQQIMILVLALLTMLPAVASNFIVTGIWFEAVPDFLEDMYVITYYFLGAYIAKHHPSPPKRWCFAVALGVPAAETCICYLLSGKEYAWYLCKSFSSFPHAIVAVAIFLALYRLDFKWKPLRFVVTEIACCSFEMYLLSYFTDSYFYKNLPLAPWQILPFSFLAAYIGARLLRFAVVPLGNLLRKGADLLIAKISSK